MDTEDLAACGCFLFFLLTLSVIFIFCTIIFSRIYVSLVDIDDSMKFLMKDRLEAFPYKGAIGGCIAFFLSLPIFFYSLKHEMLLPFLFTFTFIGMYMFLLTWISGRWLRKYVETWAIVLAEIRSDGPDQSKENNFWRFEYEQWLMLLHVIDETQPGEEGVFVDETICGSSNRLTKNNKWKLQTMLYMIDESENGRIKLSRSAINPL